MLLRVDRFPEALESRLPASTHPGPRRLLLVIWPGSMGGASAATFRVASRSLAAPQISPIFPLPLRFGCRNMESVHYSEVWAVQWKEAARGGGGEWRKGLMVGPLAWLQSQFLIGRCRGNCTPDLIYPPSRALFPVRALPCSVPFTRFAVGVESPPPPLVSLLLSAATSTQRR